VVARAGFVHPLQLARAKRDGAAAVILPLDLVGADETRELMTCAQRIGLDVMVRVVDAAGLEAAVRMGAGAVVVGDVSLDEAQTLRAMLTPTAISMCDVRLRDLRDVWMARDLGFDSVIVGEMLLKACARDSTEPATLIKGLCRVWWWCRQGRAWGWDGVWVQPAEVQADVQAHQQALSSKVY